jgi:hypothetical protein
MALTFCGLINMRAGLISSGLTSNYTFSIFFILKSIVLASFLSYLLNLLSDEKFLDFVNLGLSLID